MLQKIFVKLDHVFIFQGAVLLALIEGVIIGLNRAASEQYKPGGCKHTVGHLYGLLFDQCHICRTHNNNQLWSTQPAQ